MEEEEEAREKKYEGIGYGNDEGDTFQLRRWVVE